jgi:predicted aspartyl protease
MGIRAFLVPVLVTMSGVAAAGADRTPASVPLSIDGNGGIVVDVRINAAGPFRFILDTGAGRSLVSDDLAREIAAPAVAKSEVVTIAGSEVRLVVRLRSLAMASASVDDLLAVVVPGPQLPRLGGRVRGVLGQDFLSAFNYTLDYRRRRLTWDEPLACDAPGATRMTAAEGRFVMALERDSGAPLRLVPDSGAEMPVLFRTSAEMASGSTAAMAMVTGLGAGERMARIATMPTLRVGSITMRHLDAYLVERADTGVDGLLPLHGFSSVSFAAGGACLVARK